MYVRIQQEMVGMMLQNISLPNWYLKQTTQTAEVVYKFVRGAAIKPLQYLTVRISFFLNIHVMLSYVIRVIHHVNAFVQELVMAAL